MNGNMVTFPGKKPQNHGETGVRRAIFYRSGNKLLRVLIFK